MKLWKDAPCCPKIFHKVVDYHCVHCDAEIRLVVEVETETFVDETNMIDIYMMVKVGEM